MCRFPILLPRFGEMAAMRFRPRYRACSRGIRGKLASVGMSLSVKSMASWSYSRAKPRSARVCGLIDGFGGDVL